MFRTALPKLQNSFCRHAFVKLRTKKKLSIMASPPPDSSATVITTHEQLRARHEDPNNPCWLVVVDSYVLDLIQFKKHHPGGAKLIERKRKELGPDITPSFLDHFHHTVHTFRQACHQFDVTQQPVIFHFTEGTYQSTAAANVIVLGKIRQ